MKEVTATGQSVEEAVESALRELNTTKDRIHVRVIDEGKKGLFGLFGAKPATVHVQLKPDPIEEAKNYLLNITKELGIYPKIDVVQNGRLVEIKLSGEKMGLLIGKRGQTLNSLQYLTQLVSNRHTNQHFTITLNVEDYRERREQALQQLAQKLTHKVLRTKSPIKLEPMPSFERKIIHSYLANNDQIETYSEGVEPNRYLVISPK
ncbi:RNA-binding cell elongation regulator Jag/EloR [Heyndrickxia camelliae]|uniref:RNA-binding protein KhpB n=1 Tax=Heyndrickxia camelliae TaxID=1707093 RepID=A0A2N3LFV9_9BACI|nr:RNA-binding cell elongation regulator Jag/EloR [Heyndrickxia camelliae]PKR83489.1 protein jag [Heyndrickxia camelliae]